MAQKSGKSTGKKRLGVIKKKIMPAKKNVVKKRETIAKKTKKPVVVKKAKAIVKKVVKKIVLKTVKTKEAEEIKEIKKTMPVLQEFRMNIRCRSCSFVDGYTSGEKACHNCKNEIYEIDKI